MVAETIQRRGRQEENEIRRWQAYQTLENLVRNLVHAILVNYEQLREARIHKHGLVGIQSIIEAQRLDLDLHARNFPSSFLQYRLQSLDLSPVAVKQVGDDPDFAPTGQTLPMITPELIKNTQRRAVNARRILA